MTEEAAPQEWLEEEYGYLETRGRRTGRPHRIEIWFTVHDGRVYLLSGGADRSDWVQNLQADPAVRWRVGADTRDATARTVPDSEGHPARTQLAQRYQDWEEGQPLSEWAREAVLVEITPSS